MIKIIKDNKTLYKMVGYIKDEKYYTSEYDRSSFLKGKKHQIQPLKKLNYLVTWLVDYRIDLKLIMMKFREEKLKA